MRAFESTRCMDLRSLQRQRPSPTVLEMTLMLETFN
jgi:hypothetical protein